jgi:hypothetical protein
VVAPDVVNCSAVFTPVPVAVFVLEIKAPNVCAFVVIPVIDTSIPRPAEFAVELFVISKLSAVEAVVPVMARFRIFPVDIVEDVNEATLPDRELTLCATDKIVPVVTAAEVNETIPVVPVNALFECVTESNAPVVILVEFKTNAGVVVLLFQFHCIVLSTLLIGVFEPVEATILFRAGAAADEPNVIVPAPFVIVIPAPAVSAATAYPVPLPIKSCPFAGTVFTAVPPCAIGSTPVTPIFIFDVPLKEPAVVEARSVNIVLAVVKDAALPVVF